MGELWDKPFRHDPALTLRQAWDMTVEVMAAHLLDRRSEETAETEGRRWLNNALLKSLEVDPQQDPEEKILKLIQAYGQSTDLDKTMVLTALDDLQPDPSDPVPAEADITPFRLDPGISLRTAWERAAERLTTHLSFDTRTQKDADMTAQDWLARTLRARAAYNRKEIDLEDVAAVAGEYLGSADMDWTMTLSALLQMDIAHGDTNPHAGGPPRPPVGRIRIQ